MLRVHVLIDFSGSVLILLDCFYKRVLGTLNYVINYEFLIVKSMFGDQTEDVFSFFVDDPFKDDPFGKADVAGTFFKSYSYLKGIH